MLLVLPTNMNFNITQLNLDGFLRHLWNKQLLLPEAIEFYLKLDTGNFLHDLLGISEDTIKCQVTAEEVETIVMQNTR